MRSLKSFLLVIIACLYCSSEQMYAGGVSNSVRNDLCASYDCAKPNTLKKVSFPLTCVHFLQRQDGPVVIVLKDKTGREIYKKSKKKKSADTYCIGTKAVAKAAEVILCNKDRTRVAKGNDMLALFKETKSKPVPLWKTN